MKIMYLPNYLSNQIKFLSVRPFDNLVVIEFCVMDP